MNYLRRMVEKSRGAPPRLEARRRPLYAEAEARIEEDVVPDAAVAAPATRLTEAPASRERRLARPVESDPPPNAASDAPHGRPNDAEPIVSVVFAAFPPDVRVSRGSAEAPVTRGATERTRAVQQPGVAFELAAEDAPLVAQRPADDRRAGESAPRPADPVVRERRPEIDRNAERVPATTIVNVAIGRIDVRATATVAPRPERPEPLRPRLTLEAYLARRADSR